MAATLVGCGTPDIDTDAKEIKFGEATTRAEVDSADDILEFKVFAEMNLGADGTAEASQWIPILENERVYRTSTSSPFIYDHTRYWVENRKFNFFAVYPYDTAVTVANLSQSGNTYPGYRVNFITPSDAATDMLVAHEVVPSIPSDNTVKFQLQHKLAKINFRIKKNVQNESDKFLLTSLTIRGARRSGYLNSSCDAGYVENWSNLSGTFEFVKKDFENFEIPSGEGNIACKEPLMLIPQGISTQSILFEITYQHINADGEFQNEFTTSTYIPNGRWDIAKSYIYDLELAAIDNNIRFNTPTIEDWGETQTGGSIIIN